MAEKNKVRGSKVRHVGTFDFKETYRVLFEWLLEKGYSVNETIYKEIVQANGKEVDIWWDATKRVSDYVEFLITTRLHPLAMVKTEVEIGGVKQKIDQGDFTIEYTANLVKDPKTIWDTDNFTKNLRRWYDIYLVRERMEKYEVKLVEEYQEFLEYAKSFLLLTGKK